MISIQAWGPFGQCPVNEVFVTTIVAEELVGVGGRMNAWHRSFHPLMYVVMVFLMAGEVCLTLRGESGWYSD